MKRITLFIALVMTMFTIKTVYAQVTIEEETIYLGAENSIKLNVSGANSILWSSSNTNIVNVSGGQITGVAPGTAYITATDGSSSDICKVMVIEDYVPVGSISLSKSSATITVNETSKITVIINPSNASNKKVYYKSSDTSVVTVDSSGNITGKKVGTANVNIRVENKTATYKVTVKNKSQDKVTLKSISIPKTLTLEENKTAKLTVTYNPTNATNKNITWKSSNTSVATVDANGNVTGKSEGSATITATAQDGNYVVTSKITVVKSSQELKGISLNKKELSLEVGKSETLTVTYDPTNVANKNVTWESSNPQIATIENGKITAVSPGTTEITVTSEEGSYTAKCKVTVPSKPLEQISFSPDTIELYVGDNITLSPVLTPEGSVIAEPVWTSSDETIATVLDGIVTGQNVGTVSVTIKDNKTALSSAITINVIEKPLDKLQITIDNYDLNFDPDIKNYTLHINNEDSLKINVNRDTNKVVIGGNRDLKNGSIITITINDDTKTTYVINIKKKQAINIYFIVVISILLIINIIRLLVRNKNK